MTTSAALTITVDDDNVLRVLRHAESALGRVVGLAAKELASQAAQAGRAVTPKLGARWAIEGRGTRERQVRAPEWWAHFLAGGTKPHGPRRAPALVFAADGAFVRTDHVRGVTATHFDKKAVDRTKPRVAEIIARAIQEAAT